MSNKAISTGIQKLSEQRTRSPAVTIEPQLQEQPGSRWSDVSLFPLENYGACVSSAAFLGEVSESVSVV